jgi:hypothetical protein
LQIIEFVVNRIEAHLAGERELDDAIVIEEFVVPVRLVEAGTARRLD